jgi:hypothetical protein
MCPAGSGAAETLRGTMKRFAFKKLDAFATNSSAGNPAGVIYLFLPYG